MPPVVTLYNAALLSLLIFSLTHIFFAFKHLCVRGAYRFALLKSRFFEHKNGHVKEIKQNVKRNVTNVKALLLDIRRPAFKLEVAEKAMNQGLGSLGGSPSHEENRLLGGKEAEATSMLDECDANGNHSASWV